MPRPHVCRLVTASAWGVFVVDHPVRLRLSTDRGAFVRSRLLDPAVTTPAVVTGGVVAAGPTSTGIEALRSERAPGAEQRPGPVGGAGSPP